MFNRLQKSACILLYEYYKKNKDFKNSLVYLEKYLKAENEIYNNNNKQLIAKLNVEHGEKELKLYKLLHDKTELLSTMGEKIISNLNIDNIFMIINDEINKIIKTDYYGLYTYDKETQEITLRTVADGVYEVKEHIKLDDYSAFSAYCIKNKKSIVIDNLTKEYKKFVRNISFENVNVEYPLSCIYVPLIINGEVIGVMTVQNLKENSYDINDVNSLKIIANYASIAIKNAIEYKKMEQIANYDSLTGFLTKREIIREGNNVRTEFIKTRKSFCILMLDLDNFKNVNDTYGHIAGDQVIKMVTQSISKLIRTTDYIGRYGGDEFLLVCPNITQKNALKIADRIRTVIENTNFITEKGDKINITLSIGLYEFDTSDLSFIEGVNLADLTLYRVKNSCKNRVMCFQ